MRGFGDKELYYELKLTSDNSMDFYAYCKLRMESSTYDCDWSLLRNIANICKPIHKGEIVCNCGSKNVTVNLLGQENSSTASFACSKCNRSKFACRLDSVGSTVKQFVHDKIEEEKKNAPPSKPVVKKSDGYELEFFMLEEGNDEEEIIENTNNKKIIGEKENTTMARSKRGFNLGAMFGGLEFGAVKGDDFRLSIYGVAFKSQNGYIAYDKNKGELIDVEAMNFEGNGLLMKMPVAMSQVTTGDIIIHQRVTYVVKSVRDDGNLEVIAPGLAEIKIIMPVKNMFGFNFYTKVTPLIDMGTLGAGANEDNPFGMMMPMMLMSSMTGEDNNMDPMTMMFMMNSMNGQSMDMQSMLPLMMMSGDNSDIDPMMLMMMSGGNNTGFDMNMMLPLMMMGKGDSGMDPMMLMMMMNGGIFESKKEVEPNKMLVDIDEWNAFMASKEESKDKDEE